MIRSLLWTFLITLGGAFCSSVSAADVASWLGCFGKAKQSLQSEGQQEIVSGFNSCASDPNVLKDLTTTKFNRVDCGLWKSLSPSCQQFAEQCALNRADCEAALDTVLSCMPWTAAANSFLSNTGVESSAVLTKLVSNFAFRAAECRDVQLPYEPEPPLFYKRYCDDSDFSVGFYELNDRFYDEKNPEVRAVLLSKYADQELGEPFQRIVTTAMAIDALASKFAGERAAGAKALGTQGDFSAVSLLSLVVATQDRKAIVRKEAAKALRLQGNKSYLVNLALIQLVLNESDPDIIAEAATALRDQAVEKNCPAIKGVLGSEYEALYYEPQSLDPRSLHYGVPACRVVEKARFPNPLDENDVRGLLGKQYGCPEVPQLSAQPFDAVTDLQSVKEFDLLANRCAVFVPKHEVKVQELARLAVLVAVNAMDEKTPRAILAKAKAVASFRTLGLGDSTAKSLLFDWAESAHPEIRSAALYALARVASSDPKLFTLLSASVRDPSPVVRRTAMGVAGETASLALNQSQKNLLYYQTGIREFSEGFASCASVHSVRVNWDLLPFRDDASAVQYFNSGFNRAALLKRDLCALESKPSVPAVLLSEPENGEGNFQSDQFRLVLNGDFDESELKSHIAIASQSSSGAALAFKEFEVVHHANAKDPAKSVTEVFFSVDQGLLPGLQATLVIDKGLKNRLGVGFIGESDGSVLARKIAFSVANSQAHTLVEGILSAMEKDPDYGVRFAAAAVLNAYQEHEPALFALLKNLLGQLPAEVVDRASRFFQPNVFKYSSINQEEDVPRADFLEEFTSYLMKSIDRVDRTLGLAQVKMPQDFLEIPAISARFNVLRDLLARGLANKVVAEERLSRIRFTPWLWGKIQTAKPLASDKQRYPLYARLLWGETRSLWLDIDSALNNGPEAGESLHRLYGVVVKPGEGTPDP
jgi:hypothetical protein